jgi:hypothetical protein
LRYISCALATSISVLAASIVGAAAGQAADPTRYVSPSGNDTANLTCAKTLPCSTVQHAVDIATPGDTVRVAAGTYVEQVTIGINLSVVGAGVDKTVIKAPAVLVPSADTGDGQTSVVEITHGATGKITKLTVAGPGPGACGSISAGISVRKNATLKLSTAAVREIRDTPASGCQNGDGVSVGSKCFSCPPDVGHAFITDADVTNYQKNGVAVRGTGSSLQLHDSLIQTQPSLTIAANGVEVVSGATGDIRDNSVSGNECNNPTACGLDVLDVTRVQGSGVLVFGTDKSTVVSNNSITGNDLGIYTNDGITISHNHDSGNRAGGIYVDSGATKARITDNTTNNDGMYGIVVGPGGNPGGNTFTHDTAFGNTTTDLYQAADAQSNINNDNRCGTAVPSTHYWDCENG